LGVLTFCWSALAVWGFSLLINLRLFVNPLFRAALIFEIGAICGFAYLFSMSEELEISSTEMKMLLVAAAGVAMSRLFHVYDRIFRAEQFVLQNKSIASLLFLLRTKVKPQAVVEEAFNKAEMVIFRMYSKHAERDGLGTHHMAFDDNEHLINLRTA